MRIDEYTRAAHPDRMPFDPPLRSGRLIQRYKRFLADVTLDSGETVTAHCANPGAMLGLTAPGNRVWLSISNNPARKLKYSWEIVEADFGAGPQCAGINTAMPNRLVMDAIRAGFFAEFSAYPSMRSEVKYGVNSRVDILLEGEGLPDCYVEVKNVHLMRAPGLAEFPDCVTARGAKHLAELSNMVAAGHRAVMVYLIQMEADRFQLAADLDPAYAKAFAKAKRAGVEAIALCCHVTPQAIVPARRVPLLV